MNLHIISPEKTTTHFVAWLEAQTTEGSFVIQPGHAPMIILLAPEKDFVICFKNGKQEAIKIAKGTLEVGRDNATLLINIPL